MPLQQEVGNFLKLKEFKPNAMKQKEEVDNLMNQSPMEAWILKWWMRS